MKKSATRVNRVELRVSRSSDDPVERLIKNVIIQEGGLVDDPLDSGGITKWGISKRQYPDLNIKKLTIGEAIDIYRRDYYNRCGIEGMPVALQNCYFDMVVNMGQRNAVRVVQNACNAKNRKRIKVDGYLGPKTLDACQDVEQDRLVAYRVLYYTDIIRKRPNQEHFYLGWFRRALSAR